MKYVFKFIYRLLVTFIILNGITIGTLIEWIYNFKFTFSFYEVLVCPKGYNTYDENWDILTENKSYLHYLWGIHIKKY